MQTANNTNNYTVKGLVAKYCNFVKDNTPKTWESDADGEFLMPTSFVDSSSEQQLIVTLYKTAAGSNANKEILNALSKYEDHFYKNALNTEELEFLCEHFSETIDCIFDDSHEWAWSSVFASQTISNTYKKIIQDNIPISEGKTVYIPNTGYGDLAILFKGCIVKGYTSHYYNPFNEEEILEGKSEDWALGQIRLYAAGIKSEIVPVYNPELLDLEKNSVDIIVADYCGYAVGDFDELYPLLKEDGQMYMITKRDDLVNYTEYDNFQYKKAQKDYENVNKEFDIKRNRFFNKVIEDKAICSIVAFRDNENDPYIEKDCVMFMLERKNHSKIIVESITREKSVEINATELDVNFLWPSYYLTNRPKDGVSLSSLVTLFNTRNEVVEQYLNREEKKISHPNYLKVLEPKCFGDTFAKSQINENNLKVVSDPMFKDWGYHLIRINQPGVCLYGNAEKLVLGVVNEEPYDKYLCFDIVPYLIPKRGVDIRYIAALLLQPEVKQQIISLCDGSMNTKTISLLLDRIIVPKHTPKERLQFLSDVTYNAMASTQEKLNKNHDDYKKAVRMRKHALTQSLSSIEAMFYALNACRERQGGKLSDENVISRRKMTTVKDAFEFIEPKLKNMMFTLERIADVEYSFDAPEWIDPEQFIEDYIKQSESGWMTFKTVITWEKGHNRFSNDLFDPETHEIVANKGDVIDTLYFSRKALKRILDNIIANAMAHGFTETTRNDYQLRFSWHTKGTNLVVEIENNGNPIPADRDTASLLEYGVSGSLHQDGHNGIGCNEIDDIMRRYEGKVEIVSTPDKEFTVKYILTFKSNIIISL